MIYWKFYLYFCLIFATKNKTKLKTLYSNLPKKYLLLDYLLFTSSPFWRNNFPIWDCDQVIYQRKKNIDRSETFLTPCFLFYFFYCFVFVNKRNTSSKILVWWSRRFEETGKSTNFDPPIFIINWTENSRNYKQAFSIGSLFLQENRLSISGQLDS